MVCAAESWPCPYRTSLAFPLRPLPPLHLSPGGSQAKDLVESAPCTILTKVKREEAAKIIEKLKAETGGEYELI
jgi:hypothetical protein